MADEPIEETAPPVIAKDGTAMDGKFPHNHRLRAEALAKAGRKSDPDGMIEDDLIADAAARLAKLKAADEKAERAEKVAAEKKDA